MKLSGFSMKLAGKDGFYNEIEWGDPPGGGSWGLKMVDFEELTGGPPWKQKKRHFPTRKVIENMEIGQKWRGGPPPGGGVMGGHKGRFWLVFQWNSVGKGVVFG